MCVMDMIDVATQSDRNVVSCSASGITLRLTENCEEEEHSIC